MCQEDEREASNLSTLNSGAAIVRVHLVLDAILAGVQNDTRGLTKSDRTIAEVMDSGILGDVLGKEDS